MPGNAEDTRSAHFPRREPVLAVLYDQQRPPGMGPVEDRALVRYATADGLADALSTADALFVWDFLSDAPRWAWPAEGHPRWVHVASAGVDRLLFPALVDSDVVLTNSRGIFDGAIAEYVLGVVLAFAKDLPDTLRAQRDRRWLHRETERIAGRNALVVGTGPIGRSIARLLRAAGMAVTGVGRTARRDDPDFGVVHSSDDLVHRLGGADFVVLAAPLTEQTRGLIDDKALASMRPTARLINVGRGALLVTDDLVAALRSGAIAGAALDVFDTEPLPVGSPLWSMPNVLVSPHMSGDFFGWHDALAELFVENFRRWADGEPLLNVVHKHLGYVLDP